MVEVEDGIVESYDRHRDQCCGNVRLIDDQDRPTGHNLFFRLKDFCTVALNNNQPWLAPPTQDDLQTMVDDLHIGTRIVFIRAQGYNGHRIKKWALARSWHMALHPASIH